MTINNLPTRPRRPRRRGAIVVLAAFLLVVFMAVMAFSIDIGYMCLVRTEAQRAADAAALAAGWELYGEDRLSEDFDDTFTAVREVAAEFAAMQKVGGGNAVLVTDEDVQVGRLENPADENEVLDTSDPSNYNAVVVTVRAIESRGQANGFFFAPIFGHDKFNMEATATVAFNDHVSGFRTSERNPTTSLLPFTLQTDDWDVNIEQGGGDDNWTYNPDGSVTPGPDGIPELKLFPAKNGSGNFGTVDLGDANGGTETLRRQIREGVNADDLEGYDGTIELDSLTKSLGLSGNTGLSGGMEDALQDIVGMPRTMPLYETATGEGTTLVYDIVGFVGIRIVEVDLSGREPFILIQPAYVVDPTATTAGWAEESSYVIRPMQLVR